MRHIAPHRLGALAAGRLAGRAAARVHVHLDGCERCRDAWNRIRAGRARFAEIATSAPPELRWDRMRAQVYWSIGTGSQPIVEPPAHRRWLLAPVLAVAATAVGLALLIAPGLLGPSRPARLAVPAEPIVEVAAAPPHVPDLLHALAILIEGDVSLRRYGATADDVDPQAIGGATIGPGAVLKTGDGRIALQLDAGSTVTLAPRSTLELRRFNERAIELMVTGQIDVDLARRRHGQAFTVIAGAHTIEVRGTAFRVTHADGAVTIACEHGRVAVKHGAMVLEVGTGQALELPASEGPLLDRRVRPLSGAELAALIAARPAALPMWTDPATVLRTTAPLAIQAPRMRAVRVDGVVVGAGPVWMRVPAGRHLVEAEHARGRFAPGRWIEAGTEAAGPVVFAAPAAPARGHDGGLAGRRARKAELTAAIDHAQLRSCVRALAKQGIAAGTHVELEIGVTASGAVRFLNIAGSDLPDRAARCVRDAVAATRLGPGAAATWTHRISF